MMEAIWEYTRYLNVQNLRTPPTIRYTLDGSIPSTNSKQYIGTSTINIPAILRAKAYLNTYVESDEMSVTYRKSTKLSKPTSNAIGCI